MIHIENVSKRFAQVLAVDDLSFNIEKGEIFGLLGPNGAGKSTTLSMISGLLLPDNGSVTVDGQSPTTIEAKMKMGLAPQSLALYEDLSGVENLRFFGSLYRRKDLVQRMDWALEFVGLADRAGDRVEQYSGGMKRRLNLAATLLHDPEYLLLDEPTVGVDPQSRNKLFENVLALKNQGKTIIYTTHYMEEAQKLCDRLAVVDHGKLLALGSVDDLIHQYGGDSHLSYSTPDGKHSQASKRPVEDLKALLEDHPDIEDLKLIRPDLEQVFLNLTGRQLRD